MNFTPIIWWAIFLVPGVLGPSFGLWDFQAFLHEYFPKFVALPLSLFFSGKCLVPIFFPILASAMFGKTRPKTDTFFKQREVIVALSFLVTIAIWLSFLFIGKGGGEETQKISPDISSWWPSWWQLVMALSILITAKILSSRVWESTFFIDQRNVIEGQKELSPPPKPHWSSFISLWGFAGSLALIFVLYHIPIIWIKYILSILSVLFFLFGGFMTTPLREKWVVSIFKKPRLMKSRWRVLFPTYDRDKELNVGVNKTKKYGEENICFTNGLNWSAIPLWIPLYQLIMIRFESIERSHSTPALPTKRVVGKDVAEDKDDFAQETLPGASVQSHFRLTIMTGARSQDWLRLSDEDRAKSAVVCLDATVGFLSKQYRILTVQQILEGQDGVFKAPIKNPYPDGDFAEWDQPWSELDELLNTRVGFALQSLQFLDHNLDARVEAAANELAAAQNLLKLRRTQGLAEGIGRITEIEKFARVFFSIPDEELVPENKMREALELIIAKTAVDNSKYLIPKGSSPGSVPPIVISASDYTNPR